MDTPTIKELYDSVIADMKNKLELKNPVGKLVVIPLAMVQAAKLKLIYLTAAFVYKNMTVDTADPEEQGGTLERFGRIKLGREPFAATAGEYSVSVVGEVGAAIPANTTFKSLDTATSPDKVFVLDTDFTFTSETGTVTLRALEAGAEAALQAGDQLQVTQPIATVESFATVTEVTLTPTSKETYEDYREKTIEAYQLEPQGGAATDYRLWSQDAAGVRKVYPYVRDGESGVVELFVEASIADSIDGYGTPSQAILDDVAEVIEYDPDTTKPDNERGRRPMGTFRIDVLPVVLKPVDIVISGLSDAFYISAIKEAVSDYLYNVRPFVGGADNPTKINQGKLYESDIYGIVREVLGSSATFTSLTLSVNDEQVSIFVFSRGYIPYINTVTAR